MATELRTTREVTLPPELVALVLSFKPVASHPDRTCDRRLWEPIIFEYRGETTLFHDAARDDGDAGRARLAASRGATAGRPFAARRVSYSREDVFQGLEELYAMGGRMRELACVFGTRLRWTPPHLRADDSEQTA